MVVVEVNGYPIEPRAHLWSANLQGAGLSGADLHGANLHWGVFHWGEPHRLVDLFAREAH